MPYPDPYELTFDFLGFQNANPNKPLPGNDVDAQFEDVATSTQEIVDFLKKFTTPAGGLATGVVGIDQLGASVRLSFEPPAPWAPLTQYNTTSTVFYNNDFYICTTAHTSGATFDPTKWALLANFSGIAADAEAAATAAAGSASAAASSAGAAAGSASASANSASAAQSAATNSQNSATSAQNAAATSVAAAASASTDAGVAGTSAVQAQDAAVQAEQWAQVAEGAVLPDGAVGLPQIKKKTIVVPVATRVELAQLPAGWSLAYLGESLRAGTFEWVASDLSGMVAIDTLQGLYVAPASDPTGASGAWVRIVEGAYNIAWWGAVSGGDCAPAFQAAVNLAPDHGSVHLPSGVYRPASTVSVLKNRLTITGEGSGTYLWLADGANCDMLDVGDNSTYLEHITVRGISFDGNRTNNTQGNGIVLKGTAHFRLAECVVQEISERGLSADGVWPDRITAFPWITDNYISGIDGDCVYFGQEVYGGMISNNAIRDGGSGGAGAGVYMYNNTENMIVCNQFDECLVAINLQSAERATITGNFIENTHTHGVVLQEGSADCTIAGNIVSGSSKSQPNNFDGIVLANSQRIAVSGNRVLSEWGMGTGISETGTSDFNSISGNVVSGATRRIGRVGAHTTVQAEGVVFEATVTGTNVTGDGTVYRINPGWTVVRDTANAFTQSNGTFTAPIAGTYQFDFSLILTGMAAGHTKALAFFRRNPAAPVFYNAWSGNVWDSQDNASQTVVQGSLNVYLAADDFIEIDLAVYGGAKTISLSPVSRFTGRLVG